MKQVLRQEDLLPLAVERLNHSSMEFLKEGTRTLTFPRQERSLPGTKSLGIFPCFSLGVIIVTPSPYYETNFE